MRKPGVYILPLVMLATAFIWFSCKKESHEPANTPDLYVPTAFSPNGDGLNDTFAVTGHNIATFNMSIYDPSNLLIFQTDNINKGWDGTFKGKQVPTGSYLWVIAYRNLAGNAFKESGYVELVR